jgi:hypothetical protein
MPYEFSHVQAEVVWKETEIIMTTNFNIITTFSMRI